MSLASFPPKPDIEYVRVRLRDKQPQDFDTLWKLDQLCFAGGISYSKVELAHYIKLKSAFTIVAEADMQEGEQRLTALCAFLIAHRRRGGFGHIITIDVDPYFRKHGVGTKLLGAAHERLAREGCHTMFLEVAVNNLPAIAFYKRHNYSVVRTIPRYYHSAGLDAFLMSAKLAPTYPEVRPQSERI
jgi:[ribosomal protein S18]-alanine N-acetyltransferase